MKKSNHQWGLISPFALLGGKFCFFPLKKYITQPFSWYLKQHWDPESCSPSLFIKTDIKKFVEPDEPTEDDRRGKLLFLHLCSVDDAGHHGGYNGPLYDRVVEHANDVIERIYQLYRENVSQEDLASTTFIITADHGTKAQGGHGGSTDDEIYLPFFAWGAGILKMPNSSRALRLIAHQNSMNSLIAGLLSTIIPSNSQGSMPIHLLNSSSQVKARLIKSNNLHLIRLKEALLRKANRHSLVPLFYNYVHFDTEDLDVLLRAEEKLLKSLHYAHWSAWYEAFVLWTISAILTTFAFTVDFMKFRNSQIVSNRCLFFRACVFMLALMELYRVLVWCCDYNKEPSFREMYGLPFILFITDFILGGYLSSGRLMISKAMELIKPTKRQILSFLTQLLEAYLIVAAFHRPEGFAVAGVLSLINLILNYRPNGMKKRVYISFFILMLIFSLWMGVLHSQPLETNPSLSGHQVISVLLLSGIWVSFTALYCSTDVDHISHSEWFLLELQVALLHILLLHTYLFGLNIFSPAVVSPLLEHKNAKGFAPLGA
ncbi:hypothetical protein Aperf_G00000061082 [Anoplocephala perfoliata]